MPCYKPITAWRPLHADCNGKKPLVFGHERTDHEPVEIACGKCIGCRLEHSRQWALRCVQELSEHDDAMFLTLTYDERHIPTDHSLDKPEFQKFMKRLRKHAHPQKVRFFMAGEYGQGDELNKLGRPHYHAIIFGYRFPDMELWKKSKTGHDLMMSEKLNQLWPYGNANIGQVNFESCAYVARYVTKKINGDLAEDHYIRVDPCTGELYKLEPEYCTQSRRPGIGKSWYDKFKKDLQIDGRIYERGHKMNMPKYYEKMMKDENPHCLESIKASREKFALDNFLDNTEKRLAVKCELKERQTKHFQRGNANYDN